MQLPQAQTAPKHALVTSVVHGATSSHTTGSMVLITSHRKPAEP